MEQSSFSTTSRRNADKNLLTILLAGVGGSLVFHIAAIAGVAQLWKPVAAIDEPMEITMVDVDTEKPPAKPEPKPTVVPIVKAPAKVEPKPEAAKPVPIVKVPATLEPKPAPAKPVPIVKVPARVAPKPAPIVKTASSIDNFIDRTPAKPVSKPTPKSIVTPQPKAITPPAFPDELFKAKQPPPKTPVTPKQKVAKSPTFTTPQPEQPKIATAPQPETPSNENQSGLANNSPTQKLATRATDAPASAQDEDFGQVKPSKVSTPAAEIAPSNNNQSGLAGKPTGGGKLGSRLAGNNPGGSTGNDGDPSGVTQGNSWRGARAEPGAGLKPNPGSQGDDADSGGVFGLQCINRCEISGLTDLEDRDGGKDKLRIEIAIDPKGNVTSARIAKSSGNSTIDRVVINGVKQMQFSPPGKIVKRVVKANILL